MAKTHDLFLIEIIRLVNPDKNNQLNIEDSERGCDEILTKPQDTLSARIFGTKELALDNELARLLRLHDLAQRFGSGLKPELHRLMTQNRPPETDVIHHLDAPLKSSGPSHQNFIDRDLVDEGVTILASERASRRLKDGTNG